MSKFELTILGSNSALPAYGRFPTSQFLNISNHSFLIDCGEGCQMRLSQYKIKRHKISHIFISHLHGDHIYGLPGVIGSMNHLSRKDKLNVHGPIGIKNFLETCFKVGEVQLNFDVEIIELDIVDKQLIYKSDSVKVFAFPVDHRITCYGYLFQQTSVELNLRKEAISLFNLSIEEIKQAKIGEHVYRDGHILEQGQLTHPQEAQLSYAYCADTRPHPQIIEYVKEVDLLYFESTYLDVLKEQAYKRGHSTAKQAGEMAKKANVKKLIIGHFSSRYKDVSPLLEEAVSVFPETELAYDGAIIAM